MKNLKPKTYHLKPNSGFTLIELLIVVAILGLLASIVLVGLGGARARARDARRISDLREIQNALELYYSAKGAYPASGWDTMKNAILGASLGINKIPNDPNSPSTIYEYAADSGSTPTHYVLSAKLEQQNPALKDDIDYVDLVNYGVGNIPCDDSGADLYYCVGL
jgi:prepilin-type N-terminal cleavage/methylation domain-containing protein